MMRRLLVSAADRSCAAGGGRRVTPLLPRQNRRFSAASDDVVVAYPGSPGSLSNIGAMQFFSSAEDNLTGLGRFERTFEAVSSGEARFGVLPIENSSSGIIQKTYDLLLKHDDVVIAGERGVHEVYALCAKPGVEMSSITNVASHPVILDACSQFIGKKLPSGVFLEATNSTCEAVQSIANDATSHQTAAIATSKAAKLHGLTVLATDIGNDVFMETRYILIRKPHDTSADALWSIPVHSDTVKKRSCVFAIQNEPGSLFKLLSCFAFRDIPISKVETRPLSGSSYAPANFPQTDIRLWDQIFYLDYIVPEGLHPDLHDVLWRAACEFSIWHRDLGTYDSLVSKTEKRSQSFADAYQQHTPLW